MRMGSMRIPSLSWEWEQTDKNYGNNKNVIGNAFPRWLFLCFNFYHNSQVSRTCYISKSD